VLVKPFSCQLLQLSNILLHFRWTQGSFESEMVLSILQDSQWQDLGAIDPIVVVGCRKPHTVLRSGSHNSTVDRTLLKIAANSANRQHWPDGWRQFDKIFQNRNPSALSAVVFLWLKPPRDLPMTVTVAVSKGFCFWGDISLKDSSPRNAGL
jgi:hypothetical protein